MYVGDCNKCIYGYKCPCGKSLNSAACLSIAKKGKPKQTNADRIRSMSDEEMADFIRELNESCLAGAGMVDCSNNTDCIDCKGIVLEWLQSEVEEQHGAVFI